MPRKPTITPGPWIFNPSPRAGTALIEARSQRTGVKMVLARAFAMPHKGEREANAALMSAAPDLLMACREAQKYLTSPSITDEQDELDKRSLLVTLDAAIACATRDVTEVPA